MANLSRFPSSLLASRAYSIMVRPMRDDKQLVELAMGGDRDAFAALANRYRGLLCAAAYSVLGSREEADDVAQEALVRILARIGAFQPGGSFARWAYVIARNAAIARIRSRSREVPLDDASEVPDTSETTSGVWDSLEALPEPLKQTIVLHCIDGYTSGEIADSMGIAASTVRSRLAKAKGILRGRLIAMVRRELSELVSGDEYAALVESLKQFPMQEPRITTKEVDAPLPEVDFIEGTWFFIPLRQGGSAIAAWYDCPERKLTDTSFMRVLGQAEMAGEKCWEVCIADRENRERSQYNLWYWSVTPDSVKMVAKFDSGNDRLVTLQDPDWEEDLRGRPRFLARLPLVERGSEEAFHDLSNAVLGLIGTYDVSVGETTQRCLRVIETHSDCGILVDGYVRGDGRTVLFRRYNAAPYWSNKQPGRENWPGAVERLAALGNHRIVVDGVEYYHWYDCITDASMPGVLPKQSRG